MSWSYTATGRAKKVKAALAAYAGTLTGQSRVEIDAARVGIDAILDLNVNAAEPDGPVVEFSGSGHASVTTDAAGITSTNNGNCAVSVKGTYVNFV